MLEFFKKLGNTGGYEAPKEPMDTEFPNMTIREATEYRQNLKHTNEVGANTGTTSTNDRVLNQGREEADGHAKEQRNRQKMAEYQKQLELALKTNTTRPQMPTLE